MPEKELILGGAQIGQTYGRFIASDFSTGTDLSELFARALGAGFGAIDTARTYGDSESLIAREGWPGKIHTKLDEFISPRESLNKSLEALHLEAISLLYLCHDATRVTNVSTKFWRPILEDFQDSTEFFGLALYPDQLHFEMIFFEEISAIQVPFNILSSTATTNQLENLKQLEKKIYARSIFSQGALLVPPAQIASQEVRNAVEAFHVAALAIGISPDELAFRWTYFHPLVDGLVLGVSSIPEVNRVSAWIEAGQLGETELRYVDSSLDGVRVDIDMRTL